MLVIYISSQRISLYLLRRFFFGTSSSLELDDDSLALPELESELEPESDSESLPDESLLDESESSFDESESLLLDESSEESEVESLLQLQTHVGISFCDEEHQWSASPLHRKYHIGQISVNYELPS